jgi:hypothetical protein
MMLRCLLRQMFRKLRFQMIDDTSWVIGLNFTVYDAEIREKGQFSQAAWGPASQQTICSIVTCCRR